MLAISTGANGFLFGRCLCLGHEPPRISKPHVNQAHTYVHLSRCWIGSYILNEIPPGIIEPALVRTGCCVAHGLSVPTNRNFCRHSYVILTEERLATSWQFAKSKLVLEPFRLWFSVFRTSMREHYGEEGCRWAKLDMVAHLK